MSTPITVIVSGATGFAQHVVKQLLAKTIKSLVQLDQQPKVIIY